ncbi:4-hydroxythreonine-4-phosphate dehydrogenase PdxA [Alysiella filiformis]|uniref:4-hydroxythreonine-4-phosphate dehydrogenase n=1 Tax=Alysiella filiformis DSM 16848 TaxID=1120981 RepID=A0A286EEN1_9NEIS|nr:4-hydroxythreonine-4-phosphate dehydrogenase PdxA [Alysiella filiformis]QMT31880.1 4-hydroxythreonine-4-phosphate dehydrogenase PdxA [Alysiella filiformis]UBQ57214.1 4-hydroxythreonine-4-phosphate dehydrogenase PdxA [Alysiella filiformis DSM 16848]SOD69361.1 4-hydroxythreonine-4-phosphate dehydrogenase [Alysiella filiformis DSM 16848]
MKNKILAITSGEPAGIGADICLDLPQHNLPCRVVVLGDIELLRNRAQMLQKNVKIREFDRFSQPEHNTLDVLHIPLRDVCEIGKLNPNNSPYVLELLDKAFDGVQAGEFAAMVTAPVHKGVINDYFSGSLKREFFSGHTEYLAEKSNTKQVVMMLAGGGMRVALLTTHLPLRDVADAITPQLIEDVAQILHHDLQTKFGIRSPKILLAGLNPHAGEGGHLGREELTIMQPTAAKLREQGMDISDPLPADTLFQPFLLNDADAVLAAYHDQGLPVLKYASFGGGVNITLGLPFIRTSVDHGTALTLAGSGKADSGSLKTAVEVAWQMVLAQQS